MILVVPFGGKIDRLPLVLPLKEVRVWIVRHLPLPRPCLRAGYWVDEDDDDQTAHQTFPSNQTKEIYSYHLYIPLESCLRKYMFFCETKHGPNA